MLNVVFPVIFFLIYSYFELPFFLLTPCFGHNGQCMHPENTFRIRQVQGPSQHAVNISIKPPKQQLVPENRRSHTSDLASKDSGCQTGALSSRLPAECSVAYGPIYITVAKMIAA